MDKTNPNHYKAKSGKDTLDYLFDIGLGRDFCLGNIIKYASRAGKKEGESFIDDAQKIADYAKRLLESEKG